jgi:hypothetical protein
MKKKRRTFNSLDEKVKKNAELAQIETDDRSDAAYKELDLTQNIVLFSFI